MPVKSFYDIRLICSRPQTQVKTVKKLCLDTSNKNNQSSFIQSNRMMIDFDALAKEVGSTFCSPDALALNGGTLHFIEFKNQAWRDIKKPDLLNKFLQGVSIFGWHTKNTIQLNNIDIVYTVICNPDKNISVKRTSEENFVFDGLQKNLELSGNGCITDKEVNEHKKKQENRLEKISDLLTGLSKFGIRVKVDVLLIQEEIDEFLLQFVPKYFFRAKIKVPYLF